MLNYITHLPPVVLFYIQGRLINFVSSRWSHIIISIKQENERLSQSCTWRQHGPSVLLDAIAGKILLSPGHPLPRKKGIYDMRKLETKSFENSSPLFQ